MRIIRILGRLFWPVYIAAQIGLLSISRIDPCFGAGPVPDDSVHSENALDGKWIARSISYGKTCDSISAATFIVELNGNQINLKYSHDDYHKNDKIRASIDSSQSPKQFDLIVNRQVRGPINYDLRYNGIYNEDGNRLILCIRSGADLPRPSPKGLREGTILEDHTYRIVFDRVADSKSSATRRRDADGADRASHSAEGK
jgi:uncharacterized protein (TIGR03067 family)